VDELLSRYGLSPNSFESTDHSADLSVFGVGDSLIQSDLRKSATVPEPLAPGQSAKSPIISSLPDHQKEAESVADDLLAMYGFSNGPTEHARLPCIYINFSMH
jgi:hypothetical protein